MSRSLVWTTFVIAFFALFAVPALATTFTVVNTSDSGAGSFRQALIDANAAAGTDTIAFNIPGAGLHTITLTSLLPNITSPVVIDGYTQPGASVNTNPLNAGINAVLQVELTGAQVSLFFFTGSDGSTVRGLVINGSSNDKIESWVNNTTVVGNFLGTNATGTASASTGGFGVRIYQAATNATIGGPNAADRNLISGNAQGSVILPFPSTTGHLIQGNYIGTDATGTIALNTASSSTLGLNLISGANVFDNLISGNLGGGVTLLDNAIIRGNLIGTQRDGTSPLPNGNFGGISVDGNGSTIGGSGAGEANVIAFNVNSGIDFTIGNNNIRITQNSIHSNTALGITLVHSGTPLANDAGDVDAAPGNHGQNYPVITAAAVAAGTATISGTINSNATTALHLEFFANAACDASGFGEGRTFIGATDVNTDGSGNASFGPLVFNGVPVGQAVITSTATSAAGDTSEFSQCIDGTGALPTLSINSVSANEGNGGLTPFVFTVTLSAASASAVTVDYATADGTAAAGTDYVAASGVLTFAPGVLTQPITVNVNGDTAVEPNESFFVNLTAPANATVAVAQGTGTILNDDVGSLPTLSIDNVSASEGNSGPTPFVFTVTLSAASASTVTVNFTTVDATATAGSDFTATSGVLTFNPGVLTQPITVNVNGDTTAEPNETFLVSLSAPSNATIATGQGTGTILNDDAGSPAVVSAVPTLQDWALVVVAMLLAASAAHTLLRRRR